MVAIGSSTSIYIVGKPSFMDRRIWRYSKIDRQRMPRSGQPRLMCQSCQIGRERLDCLFKLRTVVRALSRLLLIEDFFAACFFESRNLSIEILLFVADPGVSDFHDVQGVASARQFGSSPLTLRHAQVRPAISCLISSRPYNSYRAVILRGSC